MPVPVINPDYVLRTDADAVRFMNAHGGANTVTGDWCVYDILEWWATHPYNPLSVFPTITSPATVVNVWSRATVTDPTSGETCYDLQGAINANPGGNVTFDCTHTSFPYARANVVGAANCHFLGNAGGGTVFRGLNLYGGTITLPYNVFVNSCQHNLVGAPALLASPPGNYYLRFIHFDANGRQNQIPSNNYGYAGSTGFNTQDVDWVCLGTYCVRDVLVRDCVFQNLPLPNPSVYPDDEFCDMLAGNRGCYNVVAVNCDFYGEGTFAGVGTFPRPNLAFFTDGGRACGLVNSRLHGNFNGNGIIIQINDDFTWPYTNPISGPVTRDDKHDSRYNFLSGVSTDNVAPVPLGNFFGYATLIENSTLGHNFDHMFNLVGASIGGAKGPGAPIPYHYYNLGNVFRNNTVSDGGTACVNLVGEFTGCNSYTGNAVHTGGGSRSSALVLHDPIQREVDSGGGFNFTADVVPQLSGNTRDGVAFDVLATNVSPTFSGWRQQGQGTWTASGALPGVQVTATTYHGSLLSDTVHDMSQALVVDCGVTAQALSGANFKLSVGLRSLDGTKVCQIVFANTGITTHCTYPSAAGDQVLEASYTPGSANSMTIVWFGSADGTTNSLQFYSKNGQFIDQNANLAGGHARIEIALQSQDAGQIPDGTSARAVIS